MTTIPEALKLGLQHYQFGRLPQAEGICRQILEVQANQPEALHLLGLIAHRGGQHDLAVGYISQAILRNPNVAECHNNLGDVKRAQGKLEEATAHYRQALRLKPAYAVAHNNLGVALSEQGKLEEAVLQYREALALTPEFAEALNNLGNALKEQGRLEGAETLYRQALALQPGFAEAYHNLGNVLQGQGRLKEALAYYQQVVTLKPDHANAHWNRSLALLLSGNFVDGWKEYEWRWQIEAFKSQKRLFSQPTWDGSDISGKTIFLYAEQGLGDAIQFIRYAPKVAQRGAKVIVECRPELKSVFERVEGIAAIVARGESLPDFDVHAPLLSLPMIFGTTLEEIMAQIPYLSVSPTRVQAWGHRLLSHREGLKVGLAWAGSPEHRNDGNRSCLLDAFAPLAKVPGVRFYSLQIGGPAKQGAHPPQGMTLIDVTSGVKDFADTAALISHLDLVISVDTAVAHLAGAMGRPVWTLIPFVPDWRWLLARKDSPWYPTMRLFRQEIRGDWRLVFMRVAEALQGFAGRLQ